MASLNKAMLIGNCVGPTKPFNSGCNFTVATNERWSDKDGNRQERSEFHNVTAFGKLADICNQYITKGKQVYIEGRIQTDKYTDQSGVERYSTKIIAKDLILLSSKSQVETVADVPVDDDSIPF